MPLRRSREDEEEEGVAQREQGGEDEPVRMTYATDNIVLSEAVAFANG